jgi:putative MATE family efflux protein
MQPKLNEYLKNPHRSLIALSFPAIVASLVETLYNVVDAVYVGRLGADALAAITFAWPFFFVLVALSLGINSGMSSLISRFIGEKKKALAESAAMHGLLIALVASIISAGAGIPLLRPMLALSGAHGGILDMAVSYMFYILLGIIFMFESYAVNSIFSAQGDTKTAMKIDIYSLVLNITLTPIFVFALKLGIKGAAIATSLSVLFAFIQSLYFLRRKSYLKLSFRSFQYSPDIVKKIIAVGFPSTLMILVISFYVLFLNRAMASFGVAYIAAFGIVSRLESFAVLPVYGLSVGALTLAGMFYGAKKFGELRSVSWYAILVSVVSTCATGAVFLAIPSLFLMIFTNDRQVIQAGIPYMRLDVITFPLMAITMISSRVLQGMGLGLPGFVVNVVRVLVIAVPLAYLLVFVLGYGYLSIAAAMILGAIAASVMGLVWMNRKLPKTS